MLWLVGQYAGTEVPIESGVQKLGPEGITPWAPDVLRKSAITFAKEVISFSHKYHSKSSSLLTKPPLYCNSAYKKIPIVKLQTVTLAAKLLVLCPTDQTLVFLVRYVLTLARYDLSFDVRDRARMLSGILTGVCPTLREGGGDDFEDLGGVILRREQVRMVLFEGKQEVYDDSPKLGENEFPVPSRRAVLLT